MYTYYFHYSPDDSEGPETVHTDMILDLSPGAIIQINSSCRFEVLGGPEYFVIQDIANRCTHVHVELMEYRP